MFGEIVEAVDLLYFLADKHQNKGRKGNRWQPKVEFLFQEVGLSRGLGVCKVRDANILLMDSIRNTPTALAKIRKTLQRFSTNTTPS
jgi:hypothetical protein